MFDRNDSKIFFAALIAACAVFSGCYWRSTYVVPNRIVAIPSGIKSIAVFPFKDARTNPDHIRHFKTPSSEIQEKLIARLSANPAIRVIEREHLDKLFQEQELQITGAVEPETAVQMGRILGAQAILIGSINQYGRHWLTLPYVTTLITFRLVDVETAEIIISREVEANNVNMIYPFRNMRDSISQAVKAIAKTLNEAVRKN